MPTALKATSIVVLLLLQMFGADAVTPSVLDGTGSTVTVIVDVVVHVPTVAVKLSVTVTVKVYTT